MKTIKRKSRSVFSVVTLFLLLLVVQVVMYGTFLQELKTNNEIINDLSRIRGSIQRYTKLALSGADMQSLEVEEYIDSLITQNTDLIQEEDLEGVSRFYDMSKLIDEWTNLKASVDYYRADPVQFTVDDVIEKSEACWEVSDATVVRQQYIASRTAAYYKYFTITFGVNLFAIALVLIFYKKFIYNNLAASAVNDPLTGVFNKGYFDEYLGYEIARAHRKQIPFSLIMLDIDHFKLVNDTYGHRRGDYALTALTSIVVRSKRNADVLARIGGEEFILLLPDTSPNDALISAERIRTSVEAFLFEEIGRMTISLGVTAFIPEDNKESILKRVDSALYLAKSNGRNRSEMIEGEENHEQKSFSDRA